MSVFSDLGTGLELAEAVAGQPGFDFMTVIADVRAVASLVEAVKTAGKLDIAALARSGQFVPAFDAITRLSALLSPVLHDPTRGPQALSILEQFG